MGIDPLLLYSTKQWCVAVEVVNNGSSLCRKEQKKRFMILSALLLKEEQREEIKMTQFLKSLKGFLFCPYGSNELSDT